MDFYKENTLFSIEQHTGNIASIDEHFHDLFELYYLKKGTATYLVNDKICNLSKGNIVVIPPNTLHKTIYSSDTERERILFYLDKRFIEYIPDAHLKLPYEPMFCHTEDNPRLKTIFEDMLNEFNTLNNQIYLKSLVCELLVLLQRATENTTQIYESAKLPNIISNILTYITANYSSNITLQSLSEHFYTNPSYLSRLFKLHTGFTFCNYINNYRINEANKLLTETNKSITEIAFDCGFNSSNNFCKCYKKIMEITPLAYRKFITKKQDGN